MSSQERHKTDYNCHGWKASRRLNYSFDTPLLYRMEPEARPGTIVIRMTDSWNSLIEGPDMFSKGDLSSELTSWETVQKTVMAFVRVQESKGRLNGTRVSLRVPTEGFLERWQLAS